ncbi:MAG: hypothetical protein ABR587_16485 [Candidatus Binatia bacterium]
MATIATRTTNTLVPSEETGTSATAAFEHLVQSTQGVVTKRIDLALLEGREIASDTLDRAAWGGIGVVLATAAWLSLAMSLVFLLLPGAAPAVRLATFALLNGIAAAAALAYAARSKRQAGARSNALLEEKP